MWQKCPVCNGCGSVDFTFYNPPMPGVTTITTSGGPYRETCRSCGGRGVLLSPEPPPVVTPEWMQPPFKVTCETSSSNWKNPHSDMQIRYEGINL